MMKVIKILNTIVAALMFLTSIVWTIDPPVENSSAIGDCLFALTMVSMLISIIIIKEETSKRMTNTVIKCSRCGAVVHDTSVNDDDNHIIQNYYQITAITKNSGSADVICCNACLPILAPSLVHMVADVTGDPRPGTLQIYNRCGKLPDTTLIKND